MTKKKILIVDDNRHLRVTLTDHLRHEGYEAMEADSAESALALMTTEEPDLIVLDISMPGMGGIGFLRRILGEDGHTRIPVIVLTARSSMESFFGTVPVDGFLAKPCAMSELMSKIIEVLAAHATRKESDPMLGKVLIVEDDASQATSIEGTFTAAGFDITVLATGPEAIAKALSVAPRVILLKQYLPGMSGTAVAPILAAMPGTKDIPIVLYDETRRNDDPHLFLSRVPAGVTRCVASNRGEDLLRTVRQVFAR